MTQDAALDYVPEYLSDEAKQKLRALTAESEPEAAPLEVDEYLIRHWCETLEDGNPLYLDETYAKSRGFRGVVAPPSLKFPRSARVTVARKSRWSLVFVLVGGCGR